MSKTNHEYILRLLEIINLKNEEIHLLRERLALYEMAESTAEDQEYKEIKH